MRISVVKDKDTFIGLETDGTVYGGALNLNAGALTVDRSFFFGDSRSWVLHSQSADYDVFRIGASNYAASDLSNPGTNISNVFVEKQPNPWKLNVSGNNLYISTDHAISQGSTETLKTWMTANNVQFCCKLKTPVTYQLTPQQLQSIKNTINNIWADTGKVTATFWTHL